MRGALHYHIGEVLNTNAQFLIIILEQSSRTPCRALFETSALNCMNHAGGDHQLNTTAINHNRVELQHEHMNYNMLGEVNMFNAQDIGHTIRRHTHILQKCATTPTATSCST